MLKRFFLVSLLLFPVLAIAYTSPGKPSGFVNDFAGILKPETVTSLNQNLTDFSARTQAEIAVVTIPSLDGDTIENFAIKLFEEWKIGNEKKDNGLLLLVSRDDREVRIEVGYGLEGEVTDIESSHIISDVMAPKFQAGDFDSGVTLAIERIKSDIERGFPEPAKDQNSNNSINFDFWRVGAIVLVILSGAFAKSKSWWAGGIAGGLMGLIIGLFTSLTVGLIAFLVLVPLGLLFDYLVSKGGGKGGPPWFIGGGGFGRGGGFGGFGGGSSGGGGASGRW